MISSDLLQKPEYNFLHTDSRLKNIILLGLGGSHAYGTDIESSDIDLRGIATNSQDEILLGHDFEQVIDKETDTTIYSLNKILELLINCNPNTIEILGLEPDQYFIKTDIGKMLLDQKSIFLSKRCIKTFGGYANQQLYRLQQKSLCVLPKADYNEHTAKVLKHMTDKFEKKFGITSENLTPHTDTEGNLVIDINCKDIPAENISAILSELNNTIRDYATPSKRNQKAETHGKIAKHSMHLIRLYMMCIDILNKHEIITKRTDEHNLLMDIRNGKYLDETGKPTQEFFDMVKEYETKCQEAAEHTTLPELPNIAAITSLKKRINKSIVIANT